MSQARTAARLKSVTLFLDYQIGRYVVAKALRAAGASVEVHIDHFAQDAPDTEWIPEVGRRDWVLIIKDQNIRRNALERDAYVAAKLRPPSFCSSHASTGSRIPARLMQNPANANHCPVGSVHDRERGIADD